LDEQDRLTIELVEESILADVDRAHRRRLMPDGTEFDLTAYDDLGVLLSFRRGTDGKPQFLDFVIFRD